MGLFNKLFGRKQTSDSIQNPSLIKAVQLQKGDTFFLTGDNNGFKIIRPLTEEQKQKVNESTILFRTGRLYMHYWTDNLVCTDRNDPEWQNKVLFFWKAEESFPRKSLPPVFETFKVRHFLFSGDTSNISLKAAQAMPWFGMPGLGEKHVCELNGGEVSVPELYELGLVEYVEAVELTTRNLEVLTDHENYMFLVDERITTFQSGSFYLNGNSVPIDIAFSVGGIHIIKITGLE
jgi:hypothetical protein